MNRKGIPSLSFLLGLLIGGVAFIVALLFLSKLYGNYQLQRDNDVNFIQLVDKLRKLEDGESFIVKYPTSSDKYVIGWDKAQTEAKFTLKASGGSPLFMLAMIPFSFGGRQTSRELILQRSSQCGNMGETACICNCPDNKCKESGSLCPSLDNIEKIEGSHFIDIVTDADVVETDPYNTFFIPEANGKEVLLSIRREGKTIFINS